MCSSFTEMDLLIKLFYIKSGLNSNCIKLAIYQLEYWMLCLSRQHGAFSKSHSTDGNRLLAQPQYDCNSVLNALILFYEYMFFSLSLIFSSDFFSLVKAMKAFIEANFKMIDIDNDGIIGAKEYRYNCITRIAIEDIQVVDDAFDKLLDVNIYLISLV